MPAKVDTYLDLARETAQGLAGSVGAWTAFLDTASRLYKYPFHDQLMIHAQRPEATACASYEVWNDTMRRYVRRGAQPRELTDCALCKLRAMSAPGLPGWNCTRMLTNNKFTISLFQEG